MGQTVKLWVLTHKSILDIGWWIWINMDKYGWIVLCNLWMIQLDLFWPTLTWLILFKYCSDKKITAIAQENRWSRTILEGRSLIHGLIYPIPFWTWCTYRWSQVLTPLCFGWTCLNMAFPPIPSDIRMIRPIISPKFYFIWPFFSWRLCHSLPKKTRGFPMAQGADDGSAMFLRPLLTVILDPAHGTA